MTAAPSDDLPRVHTRQLRDAMSELTSLRSECDRFALRFVEKTREAMSDGLQAWETAGVGVGDDAGREGQPDDGEWLDMVERLEQELERVRASETSLREEYARLEEETQSLRRTKRDLERDVRTVRHELQELQAARDEETDERDFCRRKLQSRIDEATDDNRRLLEEIEGLRKLAAEAGAGTPDASETPDASLRESRSNRAVRSVMKKLAAFDGRPRGPSNS